MTAIETLARITSDRFGFMTSDDVATLATSDDTRLTQCLVRCGACRFVAPAQDVARLVAIVENSGDYVRDVSIAVLSTAKRNPLQWSMR